MEGDIRVWRVRREVDVVYGYEIGVVGRGTKAERVIAWDLCGIVEGRLLIMAEGGEASRSDESAED